jgi:hypothetical protein
MNDYDLVIQTPVKIFRNFKIYQFLISRLANTQLPIPKHGVSMMPKQWHRCIRVILPELSSTTVSPGLVEPELLKWRAVLSLPFQIWFYTWTIFIPREPIRYFTGRWRVTTLEPMEAETLFEFRGGNTGAIVTMDWSRLRWAILMPKIMQGKSMEFNNHVP